MSLRALASKVVAHPAVARPLKRLLRSRWLTNLSLYQRWVLAEAARLDQRIDELRPWVLIETTLTCNARCRMCVHGQEVLRGEMSLDLYRKIIADAAAWGVRCVTLSFYGEPFADRHWLERVRIARAAGLDYNISTNASLMRPDALREMMDLGNWEGVLFSVNGYSAPVYEKMMPPLKRDQVYGNIDRFLDLKARLGCARPAVRISCVETTLNAPERGQFIRHWRSRGLPVLIADCGTWNDRLQADGLVPRDSGHYADAGAWLGPCQSAWSTMVVLHDGRVLPCCEEAGARRLVMGDAGRENLRDIFYGERYRRLRQAHRENRRAGHGICGKCRLSRWIYA